MFHVVWDDFHIKYRSGYDLQVIYVILPRRIVFSLRHFPSRTNVHVYLGVMAMLHFEINILYQKRAIRMLTTSFVKGR